MDQARFDRFAAVLGAATSRRAGLAAVLGVLLGGAVDTASAAGKRETSRGKGRPHAEGPCGDGSPAANRCTKDSQCCTKYCADETCRCKPNWMTCTRADHCCSGRCTDGRCDGGAKPSGSFCIENFNCQDGLACIDGECTASSKAKCTRANCSGCCDGTTCRIGLDRVACGTGGSACTRCSRSATCSAGICVVEPSPACGAENCPNGCCDGTTCKDGNSANACGAGGAACTSCSGATPFCTSGACSECASNTDCSGSTPVCDGGTCRALAWSPSAQFGSGPDNGDSNFNAPRGVFVSADTLTTWVADANNSRIMIWTRNDASSTTWNYSSQFGDGFGNGNSNFKNPSAIFVSADALTAWVADQNNSRIVIWTRSDTSSAWAYSDKFGSAGSGPSNLYIPTGVAVSTDGLTAWVADMGNNRISIWTRSDTSSAWASSATFGSDGDCDSCFSQPISVFVSSDALTAWVADKNNNRVSIWTRSNTSTAFSFSTSFGSGGTGDGNLAQPLGVFVSSDTLTAWVADQSNSRIAVWKRDNATATTWTNQTTFGTNGTGDTNFADPWRVCASVDSQTVWVADTGNNRIAVWTLS
jgi:DNA-binding beta-propeller fold protein YncE